jgi:hypothetical protein
VHEHSNTSPCVCTYAINSRPGWISTLADCTLNQNQGWYYDAPASPMKIELCPGTCAKLTAGSLALVAGCAPLRGMVH